jgi:hypothetical protein
VAAVLQLAGLTVEIVPAPPDVFATITREFEPPRPGVLEALGPRCLQPERNDRQPSGVSTQSARLPSGNANGARSPVWA